MTSNQSNQKYSFFLPSLNPARSRVRTDKFGEWDYQESVTFGLVADSLELPSTPATGSISSIPDVWARPLLIDMVLRDSEHPLYEEIKAQWKGMLAAIALAEVEGFKLQAELIELDRFSTDPFVASLIKLIPTKEKAAYQLEAQKKSLGKYLCLFI